MIIKLINIQWDDTAYQLEWFERVFNQIYAILKKM